ncbi:MAG: phytanoyl-CoA dioxygenase family protein [Actinobacteria bacterium]|nr:MAG: phytanoyl-CoA dioxygenase family protein [Actinomycetota bacterium]
MSVTAPIRRRLAGRAPRLDDFVQQKAWRLRNRSRSYDAGAVPTSVRPLVERLRRDGVVITDADTVFGDRALYDKAAARADELYRAPRAEADAEAGSKGTFLTKLATGSYDFGDPFVQLAIHPNALAVANGYLRLRSHLRALDVWLTKPTEGPAIQTQLWHRDGDDVMNVKMFVYFTDVRPAAGPLRYSPGTHPLGGRRQLPGRDEQARSDDAQMREVVPEADWILCEGPPGTVVFADTCGYHKQQKPETDERLLLVSHYVSGTPFVPPALELRNVDAATLSEDQHYAVLDRPRV